MTDVTQNLIEVRRQIGRACRDHGRDPESVRLLAASKRHSVAAIRQLASAGQSAFGESLVQEALAKQGSLGDLDIEWHFIGHIQGNKTRDVANHFDWVHSVAREKTARRLATQRGSDRQPLNVCLQVLLADEPGKSGVGERELPALAEVVASAPDLRLRGLMCIPPPEAEVAAQRAWFAKLRGLFDDLVARGHDLDTLSMGMSDDLEAAIAEGATVVRVGTALFGRRSASNA